MNILIFYLFSPARKLKMSLLTVTGEEDEHQEIPAKQQARFSRVVAELQMLGFIRTSNKKTDHVARLTFGGS